jgi:hypothetical protein
MFKLASFTNRSSLLSILLLAAPGAALALGQGGAGRPSAREPRGEDRVAGAREEAGADYLKAGEDYRESLRELLALREKSVARESAKAERFRGLYARGLVSKRELETAEAALAEARIEVKETRLQLERADHFLAEALFEAEVAGGAGGAPRDRVSRGVVTETSRASFSGPGGWALSDAGRVENFFAARFGRRLPVTAYGQSELHTRWGFDHRHSLDVGLHPDSPEGRALVAYLRGVGIPFIAFRSAVPGSATGPHIHIGKPSQRLRGR